MNMPCYSVYRYAATDAIYPGGRYNTKRIRLRIPGGRSQLVVIVTAKETLLFGQRRFFLSTVNPTAGGCPGCDSAGQQRLILPFKQEHELAAANSLTPKDEE